MSVRNNPRLVNLTTNEIMEITSTKISVGRSLKADLVILGQSVSRIHFLIEKINGLWNIQDQSTNGTQVNNTLLKSDSAVLSTGDVISFLDDAVSFKFELPSNTSSNTYSRPNEEFVVSETNGNDVPSVSNDHSYLRREQVLTDAVVDLTSPDTSAGPSKPTKRKKSMDAEVPAKKLFIDDSLKTERHCIVESSELECSICQELFIKASTLNCSHTFCCFCIYRWRSQRNHCPICRTPIDSINPTMVLDSFVKKLVDSMDTESREQRNKTVKERGEWKPPLSNAPAQAPIDLDEMDDDDDEDYDDEDTFDYDDDDDDDFFIEEEGYDGWGEFYSEIISDYY